MSFDISVILNYIDGEIQSTIEELVCNLLASTDCCIEFPAYFLEIHNMCLNKVVKNKGLEFRIHQSKKTNFVKLYKSTCHCYIEESFVQLSELSKKTIFNFLKSNPGGENKNMDAVSNGEDLNCLKRRIIPVYRFCISTKKGITQSIPPNVKIEQFENDVLHKHKREIINKIEQQQVIILNGDVSLNMSTNIPQFVLEHFAEKKEHCRIICSHTHRISAVTNSEFIACRRNERLGTVVGFQIKLESMSSTSTNLVYTTHNFFLRCLMGSSAQDVLRGVTHVILSDVHEREEHCDLLITELKSALSIYTGLKIILLCNSRSSEIFEAFFRFTHRTVALHFAVERHQVSVYHLEEILFFTQFVVEDVEFPHKSTDNVHNLLLQEIVDQALETYMLTGSEAAFEYFLYLVNAEEVSIDSQHSKSKISCLMAAVYNDKFLHVVTLLEMNANPFLLDSMCRSAVMWGRSQGKNCAKYLNYFILKQIGNMKIQQDSLNENLVRAYEKLKNGVDEIDHELLFKLINFINEIGDTGNILVFLPTYNDIIKQRCIIRKNILVGGMKPNIVVHSFHANMQKVDFKSNSVSNDNCRHIILTTDIFEAIINVHKITHVIDTGKYVREISDDMGRSEQKLHCWISQEKMQRRCHFAGQYSSGNCFRFYSRRILHNTMEFTKPEILVSPLYKICLYVKMLHPLVDIVEHFRKCIDAPDRKKLEQSIKSLQTIGALDEHMNITLLGIRLVDIPVNVHLGKVLIYAIALQCLDPVLTIVSSLSYEDPLFFTNDVFSQGKNIVTSKLLAEDTNSDHFVLLRLYQKWQDERMSEIDEDDLTLESVVLNGSLEMICGIRSQIIGALRAIGLIQTSGYMSMQYMNMNAHNWALVKSCFVAGMFPNICKINKSAAVIKSEYKEEVVLQSTSVLCATNPLLIREHIQTYQTDWLIFQEKSKSGNCSVIKYNSLITPHSIILFCGDVYMSESDLSIVNKSQGESNENGIKHNEEGMIAFNITDFISFIFHPDEAYLLFNLRRRFFRMFLNIIEINEGEERHRKEKSTWHKRCVLLETISKVICLEENACDFPFPDKVGERPKALPLKFSPELNFGIHPDLNAEFNSNFASSNVTSKQITRNQTISWISEDSRFFLLKIASKSQLKDLYNTNQCFDFPIWKRIIEKFKKRPAIDTYILFLTSDTEQFCGVAQLHVKNNGFSLKELYCTDVPFHFLKAALFYVGIDFEESIVDIELPPAVGNIFATYFASVKNMQFNKQ